MRRKGKLPFTKIFKKKSGIGYEVGPRCLIMLVKKDEGDLVFATEFVNHVTWLQTKTGHLGHLFKNIWGLNNDPRHDYS